MTANNGNGSVEQPGPRHLDEEAANRAERDTAAFLDEQIETGGADPEKLTEEIGYAEVPEWDKSGRPLTLEEKAEAAEASGRLTAVENTAPGETPWTDDAERQYEQGRISAGQASDMSRGAHEDVQERPAA